MSLNNTRILEELQALLKETIESPPTGGSAFLDQKTGLLDTLAGLTLTEAFAAPAPGRPSIAAHLNHTTFHMRVIVEWEQGIREKRDWQASFVVPSASQEGWQELQKDFHEQHAALKETMTKSATTDEDALGGAVGALLHIAYHLGAMRQIMLFLRAK